jgi:UDP-glucose 4-epimerase
MEKVLITGGAGLIGSHLAERLASQGVQILILDDFSTGNRSNIEELTSLSSVQVYSGSVLDQQLVKKLMSQVDFCFHLAACLGVKKIVEDPIQSLKVNIHGTENIVESASKEGVPILLASTSEIYGKNPIQPLSEDSDRVLGSPLRYRWSYSEAKALDESLVQMYGDQKSLKFIICRFFNTVGPRQTGDYGMVLPRFVAAALKGQDLEVYGDGSQSRVFCHVQDAVEAVISLVDEPRAIGDVFNVGGKTEISIENLAKLVIKETKSDSKIRLVPYEQAYGSAFEETYKRVPNINKIRNTTGWSPKLSNEEMISDLATYLQSKPIN